MSEAGLPEEAVAGSTEPGSPLAVTAGMMMRNAREAAGLHVAALAVSMKIPVKKLEALEADRLESLHDAVFVRALASSVCRALKIDPAPILDKLPRNTAPRLNTDERGINAPFHAAGGSAGMPFAALLSRPPVLIVLALLLAGVAVFFFPDIKVTEAPVEQVQLPVATSDRLESTPVQQSSVDAAALAVVPVQTLPSVSAYPIVQNDAKPLTESRRPSIPAPNLVTSAAPALAASDVRRNPVEVSGAATGTVVFKAKGASWVKVVDAKGTVQLSKTLAAGDVVGASGSLPLSIVIGRVDVTEVEVRGKVLSLADVAKDNVARFEVK